jgi:type IV secretory system conjugative DNA transfer VirD4/TraG family protein
MDEGVSLIVNLALLDEDTRRLLGCLLTVGFEQAALSRGELDEGQLEQLPSHHLMVDEFGSTASTSGVAFGHMLSQTRKFRLYAVLAHQDWEQTPKALQGAIGNCGIEVVFKVNRDDAEYLAKRIGRVDTGKVKHVVVSHEAKDRTHPVFDPLAEQWERQTQAIQGLKRRYAVFRDASDRVWPIRTLDVATNPGDPGEVAAVKARFLAEHFRNQQEVEAKLRAVTPVSASQMRRNGPVRAEIADDMD